MSLPADSPQGELFSTAGLSASLFAETDRYRLFAKLVYPHLVRARAKLEKCSCADNGRVALEPVLLLGVSILQDLDGAPDRQAVELLRYHAGWNFALNRQLGDEVFHATSLVNFRRRLLEHAQSALGFTTILDALMEAGLVSRQSRQRLDSTQMFARVARMNRLDCVRESLRLALQELDEVVGVAARPGFWAGLWERYVDSQADYRASAETTGRKLGEAGADAWPLLAWVREVAGGAWAQGAQVQLLARVFGEQFEVVRGQVTSLPQEPVAVPAEAPPPGPTVTEAGPSPCGRDDGHAGGAEGGAPASPGAPVPADVGRGAGAEGQPELGLPAPAQEAVVVVPKGKGQLDSERVQNPHEAEATYAVKGQGAQKKEHVGFKIQVAETVSEAVLAPGEPTGNYLTGIVTHRAHESDEAGEAKMEQEQATMGLAKPPVQYVDGAYVSAQKLAQAHAEGREIIGPAQPAPRKEGRFSVEDFQVQVEQRQAVCPAGQSSLQCSRLAEEATGKVSYRFEWSTHCHECPRRGQCLGKDQRHRTLVVGEHHTVLQARRQEQQTEPFRARMKQRNAIEGTQSEWVRGHGLRHARYRGLAKARLQNYFIGAACNVKRWIRREAWRLRQAAAAWAGPAVSPDAAVAAATPGN
ncbi:MAG: transposase [Methyloceanibacter sp.]